MLKVEGWYYSEFLNYPILPRSSHLSGTAATP